jgi:hypothetical protein
VDNYLITDGLLTRTVQKEPRVVLLTGLSRIFCRACSTLLVLLHALESLFKLQDQRSLAGLETVASYDAPEKIALRPLVRIVDRHQVFGRAARHEDDDVSLGGLVHECQFAPL